MLTPYLEKWSEIALALDWVSGWVEGAILPREMVFFLARCEELGIRSVIESGRQDGYSTELLGEYARRLNAKIYSIDYEADAARALLCRQRLSGYPEIELLKGDSNLLVIRTLRKEDRPCAILMDGPKGFWAMSLMFAGAERKPVRLVALHNLDEGLAARTLFESLADEPTFYEQYKGGQYWDSLAQAERTFCENLVAGRMSKASSLGVMSVSDVVRQRLTTVSHRDFKLFQPRYVRVGWKLGLDRATSLLFAVSHRFLG